MRASFHYLLTSSNPADKSVAGGRIHAFEHHTYSYKILQKTGSRDIIGLRPFPTLSHGLIGCPADRREREERLWPILTMTSKRKFRA